MEQRVVNRPEKYPDRNFKVFCSPETFKL